MSDEFIFILKSAKYFSGTVFVVIAALVVECAQTTVCLNGGVCVSDDSTSEPLETCHCSQQYLEPDCSENRGA